MTFQLGYFLMRFGIHSTGGSYDTGIALNSNYYCAYLFDYRPCAWCFTLTTKLSLNTIMYPSMEVSMTISLIWLIGIVAIAFVLGLFSPLFVILYFVWTAKIP